MISLTNHDFQWGRSEVVIICPDIYIYIDVYIKGSISLGCSYTNNWLHDHNIGIGIISQLLWVFIAMVWVTRLPISCANCTPKNPPEPIINVGAGRATDPLWLQVGRLPLHSAWVLHHHTDAYLLLVSDPFQSSQRHERMHQATKSKGAALTSALWLGLQRLDLLPEGRGRRENAASWPHCVPAKKVIEYQQHFS